MNIGSEFHEGGYKITKLYRVIKDSYNSKKSTVNLMSPEIITRDDKLGLFKTNNNQRYKCLEVFTKDFFEFEGIDIKIKVEDYISNFMANVEYLQGFLSSQDQKNSTLCAKEMVDSFIELSRKVVFNPDNLILSSVYFRYQCNFLNLLLCPKETTFKTEESDFLGVQYYYRYDTLDPFVCASLLYIMQEFKKQDCLQNSNDTLVELKRSIFIRRAEKSFKRYICVNRTTYRLELNRLLDSIIASPYSQASSLENIKPIRLFEKICRCIAKTIKHTSKKEVTINICIIGYTEPSYNDLSHKYEEHELYDLGNSILRWMEFNDEYSNISIKVNIENLYNQYDLPRVLLKSDEIDNEKVTFTSNISSKQVSVKATAFDYEHFNYNTKHFTEKILSKNDVIFLIDCPFLTDENFELKRSYSLNDYCHTIQEFNSFNNMNYSIDEKRMTPMLMLNTQYNRIMASNTPDAGEICRVFRDYWVLAIQKELLNYVGKSPKTVYVFSSEKEGLSHSVIAFNPISRVEQYEEKSFSIYRFSNYKSETLPCLPNNGKMKITISLWRMIKYASIEYAFNELRERVNRCFLNVDNKPLENPIDFHTIYRNIYIVIEEKEAYKKDHKFKLNVSVKLNKKILRRVFIENGIDENAYKGLELEFLNCIIPFVQSMFDNIYFPKTISDHDFGSACLREAFSMNIYGSARDVWSMWFWHKYKLSILERNFDLFEINYKKGELSDLISYCEISDDIYTDDCSESFDTDFFMDKKLYDLTMEHLRVSNSLSFGLKMMLYKIEDYFNYDNTSRYSNVLQNILMIYDQMIEENDLLYENCINALDNF